MRSWACVLTEVEFDRQKRLTHLHSRLLQDNGNTAAFLQALPSYRKENFTQYNPVRKQVRATHLHLHMTQRIYPPLSTAWSEGVHDSYDLPHAVGQC